MAGCILASFSLLSNHPRRLTVERLAGFPLTKLTVYRLVSPVYSYDNVCRGITSSQVDLDREGFARSEENMVLKYLKASLLMCWTMMVSLLWMMLLQQGTPCQYSNVLCVSLNCGNLLSYCLRKSKRIGLRGGCKIRQLPAEVCTGLSQHCSWS